jgi:long-chain acyl-CoA synthetase
MVTLINKFTLKVDSPQFEQVFAASSEFMCHQPGFINHRLVRSLRDPTVYVNIAEWTDAESHQQIVRGPEFQAHVSQLAEVATAEPALYATVMDTTSESVTR